jgi:hypothetical protein
MVRVPRWRGNVGEMATLRQHRDELGVNRAGPVDLTVN